VTSNQEDPLTLAKLVQDLEPAPEPYPGYRQRQEEFRRQEEANRQRYRDVAGPMLAELADVGYPVQTVGQLPKLGEKYPDAVSVLVRWMQRVDDRYVKEDVIRALAVPWARAAAPALLAEFRGGDPADDPPDGGLRWVVGLALGAIADRSLADDLIELAAEQRWGGARGMIVQELGSTGDPRAVGVLLDLLDDETVSTDAIIGLGKIGNPAARPALERFLAHPDSWIRKEAKKAIAKIDRKASRKQKRSG